MSKSKFSLGFNPEDIRYNDLILDIKLLDFAFKEESKNILTSFKVLVMIEQFIGTEKH